MALARAAEDLGYYSLLYNDHYLGPGPAMTAANHPPQEIAPIPAASLAAVATNELVVGFRVLCIDYHNPVVLAKELATLALFSKGRLEVGLGAGWLEPEYAAMGIRFDSAGVRIARLAEVVDVLKAFFAGGQIDVKGDYVTATGFEALPQLDRPPPIAIGGGGPRILGLAARQADIVAFNLNNSAGKLSSNGPRSSTAEATQEKIGWVRDAAGDRFDALQLEIGAYFSIITDDAEAAAASLGDMTRGMFDLPVADTLNHPHVLIGSVDEVCDRLVGRRETYGFSYITIREADLEAFAPVVARLAGT
jgi:probable F420-dependent oxidoreductase